MWYMAIPALSLDESEHKDTGVIDYNWMELKGRSRS